MDQHHARSNEQELTNRDHHLGLIRHIVLFRYRPDLDEGELSQLKDRFRELQISTRDGKPYILGIESGEQISTEGLGQGFHHVFIVTFSSEGDRSYYVGAPHHRPGLLRSDAPRLQDLHRPLPGFRNGQHPRLRLPRLFRARNSAAAVRIDGRLKEYASGLAVLLDEALVGDLHVRNHGRAGLERILRAQGAEYLPVLSDGIACFSFIADTAIYPNAEQGPHVLQHAAQIGRASCRERVF